MLCTECHVRKGPELAQVGFNPAALFNDCDLNRKISLDKYDIKRRKSYSTNICHLRPYNCFLLFSDSHGIIGGGVLEWAIHGQIIYLYNKTRYVLSLTYSHVIKAQR